MGINTSKGVSRLSTRLVKMFLYRLNFNEYTQEEMSHSELSQYKKGVLHPGRSNFKNTGVNTFDYSVPRKHFYVFAEDAFWSAAKFTVENVSLGISLGESAICQYVLPDDLALKNIGFADYPLQFRSFPILECAPSLNELKAHSCITSKTFECAPKQDTIRSYRGSFKQRVETAFADTEIPKQIINSEYDSYKEGKWREILDQLHIKYYPGAPYAFNMTEPLLPITQLRKIFNEVIFGNDARQSVLKSSRNCITLLENSSHSQTLTTTRKLTL